MRDFRKEKAAGSDDKEKKEESKFRQTFLQFAEHLESEEKEGSERENWEGRSRSRKKKRGNHNIHKDRVEQFSRESEQPMQDLSMDWR